MAREMEQIIQQGRSTPGKPLTNDVAVDLWKRSKRVASLEQPAQLQIVSPQPWQIYQRQGHVPQLAHSHQPVKPVRGYADVVVSLKLPAETDRLDVRVIKLYDPAQAIVPWSSHTGAAKSLEQQTVRIPAGGWYQIQVRAYQGAQVIEQIDSARFGVGDVFIVAGQSYATNTNEESLRVHDAYRRVAAYDLANHCWQLANDPQPASDNTQFGSIWPAVGDMLVATQQVPIGFANVAYGGTSSTQWLPDTDLHKKLVAVGHTLKEFRGVLWQQGESDVIEKSTTEAYVQRLVTIRKAVEQAWGHEVDWFLAKSTLHPTVYNSPIEEGRIRQAVDELVSKHRFLRGPDTDLLADEFRGPVGSHRHFSAAGQHQAAAMWYAVLLEHVQRPQPLHHAVLEMLPQLALRQPAWRSELVQRESSVLLQLNPRVQSNPGWPIQSHRFNRSLLPMVHAVLSWVKTVS